MTKVDFYILNHNDQKQKWLFACRLLEKMYKADRSVFVLLPNAEELKKFDQQLWTFRDSGFVPHRLLEDNFPANIVLSDDLNQISKDFHSFSLVNLSHQYGDLLKPFKQVYEIVDNESRLQSREKYRYYRDQQYEINTHNID